MNDNTVEGRAPEPAPMPMVTLDMVKAYSHHAAVQAVYQQAKNVQFDIVDFYGAQLSMKFTIVSGTDDNHVSVTLIYEGEEWTVTGYHKSVAEVYAAAMEASCPGEDEPIYPVEDNLEVGIFNVLAPLEQRLVALGRVCSPPHSEEFYITEHLAGLHDQYNEVTECPICTNEVDVVRLDLSSPELSHYDGVGVVDVGGDAA